MVNWKRGLGRCEFCYMVKPFWCKSIPYIYGQLGVHLPQVYVHSAICETYSASWFSIDLCSIGGEVNLKVTLALNLKVTLVVKLESDSASKLEGD